MKFSTIAMVFAVALAVAACGCRYNKAGGSARAGADDDAKAGATELATEAVDVSESDEGLLKDATAAGKNFEDIYERVTDVAFDPVYFGFDSTVLPQGELGKCEAVAAHLADKADRVVVVGGHCDDRGSNEYNLSLGENRAIIVRNYLVQNGVSPDRIQTRSYGEEKPAVTGEGEEVWSKNRRGEFEIFQK